MKSPRTRFRCVLHGSFRKHFAEILHVHRVFTEAGIEVLAPEMSEVTSIENGFAVLASDTERDPRMIELLYLHNIKKLGSAGFSYFVNPEGYIGTSASYELGIAQVTNTPCFFLEEPSDHPGYFHGNSMWSPESLAQWIVEKKRLPEPKVRRNEKRIHELWEKLIVPDSTVAVGGIIEYEPTDSRKEKELLFVKTHKWGGRYSMVGGRVRRNERLADALIREVYEETGLRAKVGQHICTFDQIKNSGYYKSGTQRIYVDKVVQVESKKVRLNHEAQEYVWATAREAFTQLNMEPNARHTLALYTQMVHS